MQTIVISDPASPRLSVTQMDCTKMAEQINVLCKVETHEDPISRQQGGGGLMRPLQNHFGYL